MFTSHAKNQFKNRLFRAKNKEKTRKNAKNLAFTPNKKNKN